MKWLATVDNGTSIETRPYFARAITPDATSVMALRPHYLRVSDSPGSRKQCPVPRLAGSRQYNYIIRSPSRPGPEAGLCAEELRTRDPAAPAYGASTRTKGGGEAVKVHSLAQLPRGTMGLFSALALLSIIVVAADVA
eukprot:COSAG06_NODE_3770_length_4925_cov_6.893286_4_plen_138_part_00